MLLNNTTNIVQAIGHASIEGTSDRATDKMKILALINTLEIPYHQTDNSLIFGKRRYLFDERTGDIVQISESSVEV